MFAVVRMTALSTTVPTAEVAMPTAVWSPVEKRDKTVGYKFHFNPPPQMDTNAIWMYTSHSVSGHIASRTSGGLLTPQTLMGSINALYVYTVDNKSNIGSAFGFVANQTIATRLLPEWFFDIDSRTGIHRFITNESKIVWNDNKTDKTDNTTNVIGTNDIEAKVIKSKVKLSQQLKRRLDDTQAIVNRLKRKIRKIDKTISDARKVKQTVERLKKLRAEISLKPTTVFLVDWYDIVANGQIDIRFDPSRLGDTVHDAIKQELILLHSIIEVVADADVRELWGSKVRHISQVEDCDYNILYKDREIDLLNDVKDELMDSKSLFPSSGKPDKPLTDGDELDDEFTQEDNWVQKRYVNPTFVGWTEVFAQWIRKRTDKPSSL